MSKISHLEDRSRLRDNLKRMGCYLILYSYEELKRWIRPRKEYSELQIKQIKAGDPLAEVREFFFSPDGVDVVIDTFEIRLNLVLVRKMAAKMLKQAQACIDGENIQSDISDESWELLVATMATADASQEKNSTEEL